MGVDRWRRLLPGLWLGLLLTVAAVATPAAFALLGAADAGRIVARVLAQEAHASLGFAAVLLALERVGAKRRAEAGVGSQFSAGMVLAGAALFCTVAGYFALQPMMEAARAGQGRLSFGQLHTISLGFFGVKVLLVAALAWRATAR
jgi:cytochrome b561